MAVEALSRHGLPWESLSLVENADPTPIAGDELQAGKPSSIEPQNTGEGLANPADEHQLDNSSGNIGAESPGGQSVGTENVDLGWSNHSEDVGHYNGSSSLTLGDPTLNFNSDQLATIQDYDATVSLGAPVESLIHIQDPLFIRGESIPAVQNDTAFESPVNSATLGSAVQIPSFFETKVLNTVTNHTSSLAVDGATSSSNATSAGAGLIINLIYDSSVITAPSGFTTALQYVVNYYESVFTNNITINIDVGYGEINGQQLQSNALGESEASQYVSASYSSVKSALQAEGAPGASTLPLSSPVSSTLSMSLAEAQALGLSANDGSLDGYIGFGKTFPFSYDPIATPASNQYYFTGVAEHEISEVMGRVSFLSSPYAPIDLYRYSSPGVHDLTPGGSGSTAYFSIDNGTTNLGSWNNQNSNGDLTDWYPQGPAPGGHDAFNDFSNAGVINVVSSNDVTLMAALGWTTTSSSPGPTVSSVVEAPSTGDLNAGKTVTVTLAFSAAVIVSGVPTLSLNDGGTATYNSGSNSASLTFTYMVAASDTNVASLAVTAINLSGGTIEDGSGNNANLSLIGLTQSGPQIDTTTPTVFSIATSGAGIASGTGDLGAGKVVTLTVNMSEVVTVSGTPTLTLNDGGTASYTGGSNSNALTFSYTVLAGQNTGDLVVLSLNPNGAMITDGAGNAANLSGASNYNPAGILQIDTTTPTVSSIATSGTGIASGTGDLGAGKVATLTVNMSEVVTVSGTPTLTLNDGGTASYTGGSNSNALTFSYTVLAGQNTNDLVVSSFNPNGATITDGAGNTANLSGASNYNPAGILQIDTTTPTVSSIATSGTGIASGTGDLNAGHVVTLTVAMSEIVTIAGGTPTLTLNDGGTASYTGGSNSSALTFSYTVLAGQNTGDLVVLSLNPNGAMITDGAGNAANLSGASNYNPAGILQIDTTTPTVSSIATSGTGITNGTGDLNVGHVVTLTVAMSEIVTIAGGTPTLTLNDGGTASYTGGSGSNTLTFSDTVLAGQNTSDLVVLSFNPNGATIADGAGNTADVSGASNYNPAGILRIDTTTPTVSSIATSGAGITNGTGDLNAGKVATLTVNMSEVVTVSGTPTLTLNDGGTASYTGGSNSSALTFSYTVLAGQNTSDLVVSSLSLNGSLFSSGTITDGAGNAADLSGASNYNPAGVLQIDTTTPTAASILAATDTGTSNITAGHVVTVTMTTSEAVTVTGTPTLQLNDNEVAFFTGGSGTNTLTFTYVVQPGDNTADLQVTGLNLPSGATIADQAGNGLSGNVTGDLGIQIDASTNPPTSVQQEVLGLYAVLYDRAAEYPGYAYWVGQVALQPDGTGVTLGNATSTAVTLNDAQVLGKAFVNDESAFFNQTYGGMTDSAFINALYVNIGGNAGDPGGITYWTGLLQQTEGSNPTAAQIQTARAGLVGEFVQDFIDVNLSTIPGLTPAQFTAAVQRQDTLDNKVAVSLAYSNASQQANGAILVPHTIGDAAYQAAIAVLQGVTYDPATVTTAIVGINNAVAHQDLLLI
jgi:hypothetical protein